MDFRRYAPFEKEELVFNAIKRYPRGVIACQIAQDLGIVGIEYIRKIAKSLYKKRKIKMIRIGLVDVYCIRRGTDGIKD